MSNTSLSVWKRLSWLSILPFLAGTMILCGSSRAKSEPIRPVPTHSADSIEVVPFPRAEDKPSFKGGDINNFSKWVSKKLRYPKAAAKAGIEGRLLIQFDVCTDGKLRNIQVVKGVSPELDAEAIRVISSSPDWKPGYVNGEPVNVQVLFPVIFQL